MQAVEAVLAEGKFPTYEEMAKAILQVVVDELGKRNTTGIAVKFPQDDAGIVYGPYYHEAEVQKALQKAQEAGLQARGGLMCSPGRWSEPEAVKTACECGHEKEQHVVKVRQQKVSAPGECGVIQNKKKCPCGNFNPERKSA